MTQATITVEDVPSTNPNEIIKIVHISGQLDESNIDERIQEIYKLVEATPKGLNLVFDMEHLEYMNSKSIGYLTDLYGKISEAGGQVAIAKAQPNILDILQVVGLTQLIKTFGTADEAKTYLGTTTAASALAAETVQPAAQPPAAPAQPVVQAPQAAPAPAAQQPTPAPAQPQAAPIAPPSVPPVQPATPPAQPAEAPAPAPQQPPAPPVSPAAPAQ